MESPSAVISSNVPLNLRGAMTPGIEPRDVGVAVYFKRNGKAMVMAKEITPQMQRRERSISRLAKALLGHGVTVRWAADVTWRFSGAYDRVLRELVINLGALSNRWPSEPLCSENVLRFLIHEFAHEWEGDHLSYDYQQACCKLGARCTALALEHPDLFQDEE